MLDEKEAESIDAISCKVSDLAMVAEQISDKVEKVASPLIVSYKECSQFTVLCSGRHLHAEHTIPAP